jgi:hypothetical protein
LHKLARRCNRRSLNRGRPPRKIAQTPCIWGLAQPMSMDICDISLSYKDAHSTDIVIAGRSGLDLKILCTLYVAHVIGTCQPEQFNSPSQRISKEWHCATSFSCEAISSTRSCSGNGGELFILDSVFKGQPTKAQTKGLRRKRKDTKT